MKLEQSLNIDIIEEEKPPEAKEDKPVIDKDDLLADVPLDDSDNEVNSEVDGLDMGFVVKPKPDITDIFDDKPSAVSEAEPVEPEPAPVVKVVKEDIPTKPTKKKRKPMSEEHKQKLSISREKALARRKYLAEQRKIEKAQAQLLKDQEQLLKQKEMDKKLKDLQSKADSLQEPTISEKEPPQKKSQSLQGLSLEQIEQVQLNAIISYEAVRKKRKEEKKKKQQEDAAKKDIMNTIKKAQPSWYINDSPYNGLF